MILAAVKSPAVSLFSSCVLGYTGWEIAAKNTVTIAGVFVAVVSVFSATAIAIYWGLKAYTTIKDFARWRKGQAVEEDPAE